MSSYINLFDSISLSDVTPYIVTGGAMDGSKIGQCQEFEYASYDDIKHADTWPHPHFGYSINRYGFRTTDTIPNEIDIAAYGCSFTYGLGLPEDMLYHTVLGKELNKPVMNFGINGASVETITDVFLITSKHINVKHAIFLLPSLDRCQVAVTEPKTNQLLYISLIPNFIPTTAKEFGLNGDMIYKYVPDEERVKTFVNCMYLLDYIGQVRNTKIYLSSWEQKTHDVIKNLNLKNSIVLPRWESKSGEQAATDLARDRKHPGPIHHKQWVDLIKDFIK